VAQPRFITLEGGEGTGKSTQAKRLVAALESHAVAAIVTREPGGSPGAEIIRHILLSGLAKPLGADTEAILFAAARDDHVRTMIQPAINAGKWVICDRFIDSTRVYQGAVGQVDPRLIRSLERVTVGAAVPDLTFILDVPATVGLARAKTRRGSGEADRYEAEAIEFHEQLRNAYRALAEREPKRCVVIDGRAPRDVVSQRIWDIVEQRLHPGVTQPAETVTP
jgi:dTMP kinase